MLPASKVKTIKTIITTKFHTIKMINGMKKFILTLMAAALMPVLALAQCPTPATATATVTLKRKIPGLLDGNFSVSATKKVAFSQGNLQYRAAAAGTNVDPQWRFAEHQYDYVGDATNGNVSYVSVKSNNASISSSYTGWIDLFGWATGGNPSSGTIYQPWESSTSAAQYGSNIPDNDYLPADCDWGKNIGSVWRTLSRDEWIYVMQSRNGAVVNNGSNARYVRATVGSIAGIILFPDGGTFVLDEFTELGGINSPSSAFTTTTCSMMQWAALEAKGCVFLPAAGYRDGTEMKQVGTGVNYWSTSTNINEYYATGTTAARYYSSGSSNSLLISKRNFGCSVRLVQDVE